MIVEDPRESAYPVATATRRRSLTFVPVEAVAVMTLAIALALAVVVRAIVGAYLHVAGLAGPRGVAGACALYAHAVPGTVDVRVPGNVEQHGACVYMR